MTKEEKLSIFSNKPLVARICDSFLRISVLVVILGNVWTVFGQPVADFSFSPDNACAGTPVSFTNLSQGDHTLTFFWEFGDGQTSEEENPVHIFHTPTGNGSQIFTVSLTVSQGEYESTMDKQVQVRRLPDTQLTDPYNWPEFSKCSGDGDFLLTVQNSSTTQNSCYEIDWGDGSSIFVSDDFDQTTHAYSTPGLYELIFTVTGQNECSHSEMYYVLYGSNPALGVVGQEGSVGCAPLEQTYEITGVSENIGTSYTFTFNDGSDPYHFTQDNLPAAITHLFTEASCITEGDIFTLVARAENQCGYREISIEPIEIDREPIAVIQADTSLVCVHQPITFRNHSLPVCGGNPNLTQYTWFFDEYQLDAGNSMASQSHTFEQPGMKTIQLRAHNTSISCNQGISWDEIQVEVLGDEALDTPQAIQGEGAGCQGAEFSFWVDEVENAKAYQWNLPEGTEITEGEGTHHITVVFGADTPAGVVEVAVRAVNNCSQSAFSEPFYFEVYPLPGLGELSGINQLCQGAEEVVIYEVSPVAYAENYLWEVPENAQILSFPDAHSIEVLFPVNAQSGNVSVQGENQCGTGPLAHIFVDIAPLPATPHEITGPEAFCQGDSVIFHIPPIDGANYYEWKINDAPLADHQTNEVTIPSGLPAGSHTLSVSGVNNCGKGDPLQTTFTIHPSPTPGFELTDHCFGQQTHFSGSPDENSEDIQSWYWDFGDGYSATLPNPVHTYSQPGNYAVSLEVTSDKGCRSTLTDTLQVHDIPVSRFWVQPDTVFVGQPVQVQDRSFLMHDTLQPAHSWYYDFGDTTYAWQQHPVKAYQYPGHYKIMQEVNIHIDGNQEGCPSRSYADVVVVMDFFMPNAFTPGGGGAAGSEVLLFGPILPGNGMIPGNGDTEIILEMRIFNRWGEQLFYEKSNAPRWDGTIRGGSMAPSGIYVWRIAYTDMQGKKIAKSGNVMLLR